MTTRRNPPVEKQTPIEQEEKPMRFRIEKAIHSLKHKNLRWKVNRGEGSTDHSDDPVLSG